MKSLTLIAVSLLLATCATDRAQQSAPSPPPLEASVVAGPEVVNPETCVDDAWLLTHYEVARLASGSSPGPGTGYPLACCAEGVLGDDDAWRCELDWPSSDVIDCQVWSDYRATLAAAHPEGARSDRVRANLVTLARFAADGHQCSSDGPL